MFYFIFSWFVSISSSLQMQIDWWNVQWVMICVFKSNNNICENMWWSNMFQTFLWISTQDNYFQIIHSSKKSGFSAAAVFINQFAHIPTFFDMYHLVRRDFRWFYFHYIRKYSADFYHMPILICLLIKTICGTRIKENSFNRLLTFYLPKKTLINRQAIINGNNISTQHIGKDIFCLKQI